MFHQGARSSGGNAPKELESKVNSLLDQFGTLVMKQVTDSRIPRAAVRSMLSCSTVNIITSDDVYVAAEKHFGMPSTQSLFLPDKRVSSEELFRAAKWEFGFDNPFILKFPTALLDQPAETRHAALEAIARAHIDSEVQRMNDQMNLVQINPIFGPAAYRVDRRLAFVLMPFQNDLTEIYNHFIKPTIEEPEFDLVCRRADDIRSNKAIIQDIWKSICEARLIIADMSRLNPNVMYELGIAHTLGKETVLIYQSSQEMKFPFDLAHIRRIEYENSAVGGQTLQKQLRSTIRAILDENLRGVSPA